MIRAIFVSRNETTRMAEVDAVYERARRRSLDGAIPVGPDPTPFRKCTRGRVTLRVMVAFEEASAEGIQACVRAASQRLPHVTSVKREDSNLMFDAEFCADDPSRMRTEVASALACFPNKAVYFHNGTRYVPLNVATLLTFSAGAYGARPPRGGPLGPLGMMLRNKN